MTVVDAVVGDHPESVAERLELLEPGLAARRHPMEENEWLTLPLLVVVDVGPVHIDPRHGGPPLIRNYATVLHPDSNVFHRAERRRVAGLIQVTTYRSSTLEVCASAVVNVPESTRVSCLHEQAAGATGPQGRATCCWKILRRE